MPPMRRCGPGNAGLAAKINVVAGGNKTPGGAAWQLHRTMMTHVMNAVAAVESELDVAVVILALIAVWYIRNWLLTTG